MVLTCLIVVTNECTPNKQFPDDGPLGHNIVYEISFPFAVIARNQVRSKRSKFTKFVIILAEQKLCSLERRMRAQFVLCEDDYKFLSEFTPF